MNCSRCGREAAVVALIGEEVVCIDCSGEGQAFEAYQEAFYAFLRGESKEMPRMMDFLKPGSEEPS
jgi:hypothetical protein